MKFNKIKILAFALIIASLAIIQYGCETDGLEANHSSVMKDPSTATVAINTIKDSTAMLDYSVSAIGRIFIVVIPGTDETVTPTSQSLLKLSTTGAVFKKTYVFTDASSLGGSVQVTGLAQNTSYKVYALPVNEDGVLGTIATTNAFVTSDNHAPELSGVSPSISSSAAQTTTFNPVLTFNEPVVLANTFSIQVGYRNAVTGVITNVDVPAENISISGSKVTITKPQAAMNGQYVFLSIGAGSILDRAGNAYVGIASGLSGTTPVGLYWRVLFTPTAAQQILPTATLVSDVAMKIVIDYPIKMRFPSSSETAYDQTKVLVRYTTATTTMDVQVPKANVAVVNDTLVQITLPRTPVYGETVTFTMNEGAMHNSYGNPSAAIAFGAKSWFISYGYSRSLIIGTYTVTCNSGYDPYPAYTWTVTVAAKAGSTTGVEITGLENSTSVVNGVFNGDYGTLTIAQDQSLGDLVGDGSSVLIFSTTTSSGDLVGAIQSNGNMTMTNWASYIVGGTYDGYYYDKYTNTVWTKTAKSAIVSPIKKAYTVKTKK